jgi:hypothetical protein
MDMIAGRSWRVFVVMLGAIAAVASSTAPTLAQAPSARDDPVALGESGTVAGYEIVVADVVPDATDIVLAENQFNEPPAEDHQFFMVRLGVTYTGDGSGSPWFDLTFNAVGAAKVAYATFLHTCGVIPDDASEIPELFASGEAEFNICWEIREDDAGSLAMYVEDFTDFEVELTWFSLGMDGAAATPVSDLKPKLESDDVVTGSSRTEPIPFGETGAVGDLHVTVDAVEPLADELIAAANEFNEPPETGNQFFMAAVTVTNAGLEVASPWMDLNFQAVGDASVGYTEFDNSCGVVPDGGTSIADVFPGGTVTFNVCWQIASDDAGSLVMYIDPLFSFDDSERAWFALDEG